MAPPGTQNTGFPRKPVVILANHRYGRELQKVPVAKGGKSYRIPEKRGMIPPSLKDQVGSQTRGMRLKKLASIERDVSR